MSVQKFSSDAEICLCSERKTIEELVDKLPNREIDGPDVCISWSKSRVLSKTYINLLEASGYEILVTPDYYIISFSEETKEDMEEDQRRERLRKSKSIRKLHIY